MRHKLAFGMKASELLGWIQIPSKCCPVRFGNRTFPTASEGASNQMQPRSTCVLVQLLLRCSGPVPLPTVRQPRPNDTPYIPTHDTKAWSIKWKLSPNKVQCIDKSSCFWMLSYSQNNSSLHSLCSKYCYVHYRHEAPNRSSCIHHPRANSKHCIPRNINLVQTEIWDQTILAAWINEAGVWMRLKLHQTLKES